VLLLLLLLLRWQMVAVQPEGSFRMHVNVWFMRAAPRDASDHSVERCRLGIRGACMLLQSL
jgi:hypothetical protein